MRFSTDLAGLFRLRVVQKQAILILKSMPEGSGSDVERL